MKNKKMLSLLLVLFTSTLIFSGCSKTDKKVTDDASMVNAELKMHYHANNKYTLSDKEGKLKPVFAFASEKTGIKITDVANPVGTNSLNEFQLQATQKFPADIYGGNSLAPEMIKYGQQGAFLPLNDLIDKDAPNLKKFLDANPKVKKSITAADGKIYYIPYVPDPTSLVSRGYFIRTDWLAKLNLQTPKTIEELEKVLLAFKNGDPNGNGKKDEIPYFNDKMYETIRLLNLWGARVYGNDSFTERVVLDSKDNMYHAWLSDDFKNALINMNRWYSEGLIDPEFATRKDNTARPTLLTKSNVGGMTHEWIASTSSYNDNAELKKAVPDFKFEAILPPTYNGKSFEEAQRMPVKPDGWAVSANCKNTKAALKFIDYFFSPEGKNVSNFGVEGQTWTMKNGKPTFTDEVLKQTGVNNYLWETQGAQYPIGYPMTYDYEAQWTNSIGKAATKSYHDAIIKNTTPVMQLSTEEKATYDKVVPTLNGYLDEQVQKMITGQLDINKNWDSYVKQAKIQGADDLVKAYTSAYNRYKTMK
ncbi:extracellular solute-binding protein [Clostridium sp. CF012]|uniref:extracellular solute-binding protein n=1 Tax=Clostridium sp. CF012 TaxID=2843319 RepID=UPI001C0E3201|nr:extracellular solute-binding protein [Clostridium sp. CF012]MBU3142902.1 extracellular solute-binding protein [Clostridium sp. CF012]